MGTCFQVAPAVLVTAWHVLADLGCERVGCEVLTDALDGSSVQAPSQVVAADAVRDLAVLRRAEPLRESVGGWATSDTVTPLTKVVVTGVAEVDDPGHDYEFLQAMGEWRGGTVRDGVALGRLASPDVMRGMSGAPVARLDDGLVLGVVSARYNSADNWLRDSVWVARTEDLTRLLEDRAVVPVRRRLVLGDEVGVVRYAGSAAAVPVGRTPSGTVGPVEAAHEARLVLRALDDSCRGAGGLDDAVEHLVSRACGTGWNGRRVEELHRRLRLRGLEPRVLLPRLAGHEEAVHRWSAPLPGTDPDREVSEDAARVFLTRLRQVLAEELEDGVLAGLSHSCRTFLREAVTDGDTIPLSGFLHALSDHLTPLRSASVEAVPLAPATVAAPTGGEREDGEDRSSSPPRPVPGRPELAAVARQMCRLPAADPCVAGRERVVSGVVAAIDRHMTRHGAATAFLCGQPGVGTSVVAVEAARALTPAFPGGVLYVDLHGLVPDSCLNARTVVRVVSEALGLDLGAQPMDDARMIASLNALLHDRQVLLVLDNARDAAHVRPFVKAPAGCGVIVTSRDRAQDYADRGLVFEVGPLERGASVEVLTRCSEGRDHAATDDGFTTALHRMAHLCADLPLALRIVGARLAQPSGPQPSYLVQLLEEESARLDALSYGDRAVRLAIRLSHDALEPAARRILRLVTAAPGAAVTGAELGHCLSAPALRQELLLNRLVDRSLALRDMVRMPAGELLATFRLFDLVRLFALERLDEDEPPDVVREFQRASVSYLCARLTEITNLEHGAQLSGELDPTRFHAAQRLAQDNEWLDLAADLAIGLHVLYTARGELDAIVGVNDDRIALHLRQGRPEEAVKACLLNAETLRSAQAAAQAADAARQAAGIAREYGLTDRVAEAEFMLSLILWDEEKWVESLAAGERAVTLLASAGQSAAAVPVAINNCRTARRMEDVAAAVRWGRTATDLAEHRSTPEVRAMALNAHGLAEEEAGNDETALVLYRRAAALWEAIGNHNNAALDHANAAYRAQSLDDPATVVHLLQHAAELWQRAENHPRALEALVDLSSVYAAEGSHEQAAQVLARAERLALGAASEAPALLRCEVLVRNAAVLLYVDDTPGNELSRADGADGDVSVLSEVTKDDELARVHGVLGRHRTGDVTVREARKEVLSLLTTRARHQAPRNDPWVYEHLGEEARERPALGT
ncbi:NB-ARC domain-containing protein [Streptomyces sp. NPDC049627]|uniref:NB-ARC domain-containing protein n=1 Tax=Streptomyces sp. NPDC049627 TaxID=3365595 RepID=UPI00379B8859